MENTMSTFPEPDVVPPENNVPLVAYNVSPPTDYNINRDEGNGAATDHVVAAAADNDIEDSESLAQQWGPPPEDAPWQMQPVAPCPSPVLSAVPWPPAGTASVWPMPPQNVMPVPVPSPWSWASPHTVFPCSLQPMSPWAVSVPSPPWPGTQQVAPVSPVQPMQSWIAPVPMLLYQPQMCTPTSSPPCSVLPVMVSPQPTPMVAYSVPSWMSPPGVRPAIRVTTCYCKTCQPSLY